VVEAEQVQDRRVQVVHVDTVGGGVEAEVVRLAQRQARLKSGRSRGQERHLQESRRPDSTHG
jgi:hypothetical protein